jgi:hypothetical protein
MISDIYKELNLYDILRTLEKDSAEYKFLRYQIDHDGLENYHITLKSGLSKEKELEVIKSNIRNWNSGREKLIVEL